MPKFTIEEHEKRMRELLKPKPQVGQDVLQFLLSKTKNKKPPVVR